MRVLHVEDDANLHLIVKETLPEVDLVWVDTMTRAEVALSTERFDLILTDLRLVDSVGAETVHRLSVFHLPIFVLSGHADHEAMEAAIRADVAGFLGKDKLLKTANLGDQLEAARARFARRQPRRLAFANLDSIKPFITCCARPALVGA